MRPATTRPLVRALRRCRTVSSRSITRQIQPASVRITGNGTFRWQTTTSTDTNNSSDPAEQQNSIHRRNAALAAVLRNGIAHISSSAAQIQASRHTKKPLFLVQEDNEDEEDDDASLPADHPVDPRQRSEEHRILTVATECLEELSRTNPILCVDDNAADDNHREPIQLLAIRVKPSLSVAVLYWSLPPHHLAMANNSENETGGDRARTMRQHYLEYRMTQALDEGGGAVLLQRRVHAVLRGYYPPKLQFRLAPPILQHEAFHNNHHDNEWGA